MVTWTPSVPLGDGMGRGAVVAGDGPVDELQHANGHGATFNNWIPG